MFKLVDQSDCLFRVALYLLDMGCNDKRRDENLKVPDLVGPEAYTAAMQGGKANRCTY